MLTDDNQDTPQYKTIHYDICLKCIFMGLDTEQFKVGDTITVVNPENDGCEICNNLPMTATDLGQIIIDNLDKPRG